MMLFPLLKFTNSRFLTRVFLRIEIDHPFLIYGMHSLWQGFEIQQVVWPNTRLIPRFYFVAVSVSKQILTFNLLLKQCGFVCLNFMCLISPC